MSNEMIAIIGRMLNECRDIRRREKISCATAADILHGFATEIFDQLKKEEKVAEDLIAMDENTCEFHTSVAWLKDSVGHIVGLDEDSQGIVNRVRRRFGKYFDKEKGACVSCPHYPSGCQLCDIVANIDHYIVANIDQRKKQESEETENV